MTVQEAKDAINEISARYNAIPDRIHVSGYKAGRIERDCAFLTVNGAPYREKVWVVLAPDGTPVKGSYRSRKDAEAAAATYCDQYNPEKDWQAYWDSLQPYIAVLNAEQVNA